MEIVNTGVNIFRNSMSDYDNVDLSYLTNITFEDRNFECVTTGHMFNHAKDACSQYGLSYYRMKRHLNGEVPSLKGMVFRYGPTYDVMPKRK